MSGYVGFSRSVNAANAMDAGRMPATHAAKGTGLPVGFIRDCCGWATGGEWHHTSKFYNCVDFYDCTALKNWRDAVKDADGDCVEGRDETCAAALARWRGARAVKQAAPVTVYAGVTVEWLEWGGTRNHPSATKRRETGATIEDAGGKMVIVKLASGANFRKGKDTNGFRVIESAGNRIFFRQGGAL